MAVTEALMSLFIKEMVPADRVVSTIQRFAQLNLTSDSAKDNALYNDSQKPAGQGEALLLWVTRSGDALKQRIIDELVISGDADQVYLQLLFLYYVQLIVRNVMQILISYNVEL